MSLKALTALAMVTTITLVLALSGGRASAQVIGPNVEELAKELSNPGAANATQIFKLEYRTFDGERIFPLRSPGDPGVGPS